MQQLLYGKSAGDSGGSHFPDRRIRSGPWHKPFYNINHLLECLEDVVNRTLSQALTHGCCANVYLASISICFNCTVIYTLFDILGPKSESIFANRILLRYMIVDVLGFPSPLQPVPKWVKRAK
jgi:hypothetical protein